jgi:hypothetical protein
MIHGQSLESKRVSLQEAFDRTLHSIYIINDVFFNCAKATTHDVTGLGTSRRLVDVIECMLEQISPCFVLAYRLTTDDEQRDRLRKVIELWKARTFISDEQAHNLLAQMANVQAPIIEPSIPLLTSPYMHALPAPRAIASMQAFPQSQALPALPDSLHARPPSAFGMTPVPSVTPGSVVPPIMVAPIIPKIVSPKEQFGNLMHVSVRASRTCIACSCIHGIGRHNVQRGPPIISCRAQEVQAD